MSSSLAILQSVKESILAAQCEITVRRADRRAGQDCDPVAKIMYGYGGGGGTGGVGDTKARGEGEGGARAIPVGVIEVVISRPGHPDHEPKEAGRRSCCWPCSGPSLRSAQAPMTANW